jgi:hypothetical protein
MNIILSYKSLNETSIFEKNKWEEIVDNYFVKLKSKQYGNLISTRLELYCMKGYSIEFTNDKTLVQNNTKGKYMIFIPSDSNLYEIEVFNHLLEKFKSINYNIIKIATALINNKELNFLLSKDNINELKNIEITTSFLLFVHYIIKALRYFENITLKESLLEDGSTIYGLNGFSLYINDNLITENIIRKEWGERPRISGEIIINKINI